MRCARCPEEVHEEMVRPARAGRAAEVVQEVTSRWVYRGSIRADGTFVCVDCEEREFSRTVGVLPPAPRVRARDVALHGRARASRAQES